MTTWTKTDLARMQLGLDFGRARVAVGVSLRTRDDERERLSAKLITDAREHVLRYLADVATAGRESVESHPDDRCHERRVSEGRAAERLIEKLKGSELPSDTLAVQPFELQHLTESDQVRVDRMLDLGMSDQAFYIVSTARERWLAEQTQRVEVASEQTRRVQEIRKPLDPAVIVSLRNRMQTEWTQSQRQSDARRTLGCGCPRCVDALLDGQAYGCRR